MPNATAFNAHSQRREERLPTDVREADVRLELRRRLTPAQLELFTHLAVA